MTPNPRPRPRLTEELERCLVAAKGLAARERAEATLDSLHLVLAAVGTAPQAAQAVLERAGYSWEPARKSCLRLDATVPPAIASKPMGLVRELWNVMYGRRPGVGPQTQSALGAEECLELLLKDPSVRLRDFLRVIAGKGSMGKQSGAQVEPEYRSFREYLASRRQVWFLRFAAWNCLEEATCDLVARRQRRVGARDVEQVLNELTPAEEQTAWRSQVSPPAAAPLRRLAEEHDLTPLQCDLLEGALLYELYGGCDSMWRPLLVRELAQALAPETYPRNCQEVVQAVQGLSNHHLLEIGGAGDPLCTLACPIRLASDLLEDFLARIAQDTVNESDLKSARRRLAAAPTWPL